MTARILRLPKRTRATGVVASKLSPPAPRRDAVERVALGGLEARFPGCPLVLVRAPAGYGKTSVLAQWRAEADAHGAATSWLTLDAGDDDPARLFTHLAVAIGRVRKDENLAELQAELQATSDVMALVDWLELPEGAFTLFLDDFEAVRHDTSIAIVRRLASRFEEPARLVIASRSRVSLGVGKKRVLGRLVEIDERELLFSAEETRSLLAARGVTLDSESLASLLAHTEGWPAAIELAALALAGRDDGAGFVASFSGSFQDVAEFLSEEVLERQPPDLRAFLLDTCILACLRADLCDAIRSGVDSATHIERLEEAGVPLRAIDVAGEWHRYHPVFAEFLQKVQRRELGPRVAELHRAAARWHSQHGHPIDAVDHALAASDSMLAAELVEPHAKECIRQGQFGTVVRWAEALPPPALDAHPQIRSASAWSRLFLSDFKGARRELDRFRARAAGDCDRPEVEDEFAALEPTLLAYEDRIPDALEAAQASLPRLRAGDPFNQGCLLNVLAWGLTMRSELADARRRVVEARAAHALAGSLFGIVYSITIAGLLEAIGGNLPAARRHFEEAEALAAGRSRTRSSVVWTGVPFFAEVLYEIDELEAAETRLETWFSMIRQIAPVDMVIAATLTLTRIHGTRGRFADAEHVLDDGDVEALQRGAARMRHAFGWERVRLALARGAEKEARALRDQIPADDTPEPEVWYPHGLENEARDVGELRYAALTGDARRVLPAIRRARARAEDGGRGARALRLSILEAIALDMLDERTAALQALRPALSRGAAGGFVRSFVDEGPRLVALLHAVRDSRRDTPRVPETDFPTEYLDRLLAAAGAAIAAPIPAATIAEPLSDREREILTLLTEGLPNRLLARRLFVSENTVKWHLKRIYEKLGVSSRAHAVAVARSHQLVRL